MRKNIVLKLLSFVLFVLCATPNIMAQPRVYTYYLNTKMESVPKDKAVFMGKGRRVDSIYMMQYYATDDNRLLWMEQFKDSTLEVLHGDRLVYYPNRKTKEKSHFQNNMLTGLLVKWDSTGNVTDSGSYKEDRLQFYVKRKYVNRKWLHNSLETDSVNNTMKDTDYDSLGNKVREIAFIGNSGTWTEYNKDGTIGTTDSVFTREEIDAAFPPKNGGWRAFLEKNLDGSVPIRNGATGGQGTVTVQFIVEKDGTITNIKPLTNIGFGAEDEVLRILKKSPKWIPATRYGKAVKAYRKQPVTFAIRR